MGEVARPEAIPRLACPAPCSGRGRADGGNQARRHLTRIAYPEGALLDYGYDARGARTSLKARTSATASALTTSTAYDAIGEPVTVTDPQSRNYGVGYDADGN